MRNKRNVLIALILLAALLIFPFRGQLRQAFSGSETGAILTVGQAL